jgi:hypothetical protein
VEKEEEPRDGPSTPPMRILSGQLVNSSDSSPLPGVRLKVQIQGAAGDCITDRFGMFGCVLPGVEAKRIDDRAQALTNPLKAKRPGKGVKAKAASRLRIFAAAPDGAAVDLVDVPTNWLNVHIILRARIAPTTVKANDWNELRRLLGDTQPTTVAGLAQQLVSPTSFELACVPAQDRMSLVHDLEVALLDPKGRLASHFDSADISVSAFRSGRRNQREWLGDVLTCLQMPAKEALEVMRSIDHAAKMAARGTLFEICIPLSSLPGFGKSYPALSEASRRVDQRWAESIVQLGLSDDVQRYIPATLSEQPRAWLQQNALDVRDPADVSDAERRLSFVARLTSLGATPSVAAALTLAGTKTIHLLARQSTHSIADKLDKLDKPGSLAQARQLQIRARQALALMRARMVEVALATGASTASIALYANRDVSSAASLVSILRPMQAQAPCEACESCLSALSPGAYLVDLLDFVSDSFGLTLDQIELRFTQPFGALPLDCDAVEKTLLQNEFANEVLARFIRERRSLDWRQLGAAEIDVLYAEFATLAGQDVFPTALGDIYDAYRLELRVDVAAITEALDDAEESAVIARSLGLDVTDLRALILARDSVARSSVLLMGDLLLKSKRNKTQAILEDNLHAQTYAAARERLVNLIDPESENYAELVHQAEAQATGEATEAVNAARQALAEQASEEATSYASSLRRRLDKELLPHCRANLIRIALQAIQINPVPGRSLTDARSLGDFLCVDLQSGDCLETTRVAFSIESLQTFVQAYLLGREGIEAVAFDALRWRWMRSFGLATAAQAVFLYPENFLSPQFRTRRTAAFQRMTEMFDSGNPSRAAARSALLQYSNEVRDFSGNSALRVLQVRNKLYALCVGAISRALYCSSLDVTGTWSDWQRVEGLPAPISGISMPQPDVQDVVVLRDQIYVLYRGPAPTYKLFVFVFDPQDLQGQSIEVGAENVRRARAVALDTPFRQQVVFFVQSFPVPPSVTEVLEYEVLVLGMGEQQTTAAPKKIYLPSGTSLRGLATHTLPTDIFRLAPLVVFTCLHSGNVNTSYSLVSYLVPAERIPPSAQSQGDLLLTSFPSVAIDLQANVEVSALSVMSLGLSEYRLSGTDQIMIAFRRQSASPDWAAFLVDGVSTGPVIAKTLISSANADALPEVVRTTVLSGACTFNQDVYGVFGSWMTRMPSPTEDWNSGANWRLTGQIFLGAEQGNRSLLLDIDALGEASALAELRALQLEHWDFLEGGGYARRYVEELFLHVPLWLAARLNEEERYEAARELIELVFRPLGSSLPSPFIYEGILREQTMPMPGFDYRNTVDYLHNPFDPHAIAGIRPLTYARYVVQAYVDNMIDWADAEFTRDSPESVAAARELYENAENILGLESVPRDLCASGFAQLMITVLKSLPSPAIPAWRATLTQIWTEVSRLARQNVMQTAAEDVQTILRSNADEPHKRGQLHRVLTALRAQPGPAKRTLKQVFSTRGDSREERLESWGMGYLEVLDRLDEFPIERLPAQVPARYFDYGFCIPRNPVYEALRFRIESNLSKIRSCRNIAGIRRSLESYAAAQDPTALVQQAAAGGGDIEDFIPAEPPPMFRYSYLWERARQSTTNAQHLEAYLLASFEKADAAAYSLLQAKNDLKMATEHVALQALRVREAGQGVTQAQLQRDKARYSGEHFSSLLEEGESTFEQQAILLLRMATFLPSSVSVATGAMPSVSVGFSPSGMLQNQASILNTLASYERRAQEWQYQIGLASWDERIGEAQIDIAGTQIEIANRELETASVSAQLARQTVEFLSEQFSSVELYKWMIKELRKLYRRQLSLAVGLGRAAQQALAFELQEPLNFVGTQYWELKREGLIGAEKLGVDLERLDDHRLGKAERRREITKTISLALRMPSEFQQFRQKGLLTFATPMSWFDRDYPGQYMRLIRSVEFSLFALTPAVSGIHANVSHHGLSRVMVGPPFVTPVILQRPPETVSLSVARADSGLFQLRLDDPMLLPFEGSGVDATWTVELAKGANSFNFDTLVDVLMTIRYTAKEDYGYRQRVVAELETELRSMASFSARQTFADAWFHLHNPIFRQNPADYGYGEGKVRPPYTMRVELGRHHFPANEEGIALRRLLLVSAQEQVGAIPVHVEFLPVGAVAPLAIDGEIVNGTLALGIFVNRPPFGFWTVRLRNEAPHADYPEFFAGSTVVLGQTRLNLDGLRDLALLVDYSARVSYPRA